MLDNSTVKIWDASSDIYLQTFKIDKTLFNIFFNAADLCLHTEISIINIDASSFLYMILNRVKPQDSQY